MKYSGFVRRILGGFGIWIGVITLLIFGMCGFMSKKLYVFSAVLCFQALVISIASANMSILEGLIRSLGRANLIVQWISTIYITQMLFLLLQIPESEIILRLLITYTCNSVSILYAMWQLPAWQYHVLIRQMYWSTIRSSALLSAFLAYLTVMFLQSAILFSESEKVRPMPSPLQSNLNWLFLENCILVKLFMLFIFQAFAYHTACIESGTVVRYAQGKRRFG